MNAYKHLKTMILLLLILALSSSSTAFARDCDFIDAIHHGAIAQCELEVVDENMTPLDEVKIVVNFDSALESLGDTIKYTSNSNGTVVVSGRTGNALHFTASKDGYYDTTDEICYIALAQGVKKGKWLPWNAKKSIVLRRKINPVAIKPLIVNRRYTKELGKWLGFDVQKYDFVSPVGSGVVADMEIRFDWDGTVGRDFHGIDMTIRFIGTYDGAYCYKRNMTSAFKDSYVANKDGAYEKEFKYYSHPIRDSRGRIVKRDQKLFDINQALILRSRCVVDENESLKSVQYSEISDLTFGCSEKGAWVMFQPIFNPTPNDTNLEPKR